MQPISTPQPQIHYTETKQRSQILQNKILYGRALSWFFFLFLVSDTCLKSGYSKQYIQCLQYNGSTMVFEETTYDGVDTTSVLKYYPITTLQT